MPPPLAPYGMCLKIMNERNTKGGTGLTAKPLKFLDQDYNTLQDYCLKNDLRFVDEFFPPDLRSIGKDRLSRDEMAKIEWKRPMIISKNARFVVDGVSRFDYAQGKVGFHGQVTCTEYAFSNEMQTTDAKSLTQLLLNKYNLITKEKFNCTAVNPQNSRNLVGNCWFLASVGALTFQKKLFPHIVPHGQSLCNNYAGIFHFRFWRFGRWYDVVIDDKLPTIDGKLIFVQSKTSNEFWPALLEKAYAKVCGSYADMHAGRVSEALLDFSGGVHMHFDLKSAPADLWEMMYRASQAHALMGCETAGGGRESLLPNGIVMGHAYTVTGVYRATIGGHPVQLVRLFNPWGNTEWTGDWSDYSPLWNRVSERDRKEHHAAENGEFWMSMKDFTTFFDNMDIVSRCPDFLEDTPKCQWTFKYHYGRWVTGSTAGGGMHYKETFCRNPQFWLRVNEKSKGCEDGHNNVLVSLIQIPDKRNRRSVSVHAIAFSVFAIPPEMRSEGKFEASFFQKRKPVEISEKFERVRQVMKFFRLDPGHYLIVPYTHNPNQNAEFFMSILCKNEIHIEKDTERTEKDFLVDFTKVHYTDHVDEESKNQKRNVALFRQYSDQYKDVDACQLQQLLHQNLGDTKVSEGFGLDTCRSLIAMSDSSVAGKLDGSEFMHMWNRILKYKEIFYSMDSSKDCVLSLNELRNALEKTGMHLNEDILTLMIVRYGGASEQITLEGFICLVMRLNCMASCSKPVHFFVLRNTKEDVWQNISIFQRLCDGGKVTLDESEWIRLTMYS